LRVATNPFLNACAAQYRETAARPAIFSAYFKGLLRCVNFSMLRFEASQTTLVNGVCGEVRQRVALRRDAIDRCEIECLLAFGAPLLCERLLMESRRMTFVEVKKTRQWI
jgi:hypothetical protein